MNFTPKGSAIMLSNEFQPSVGKAQSTLQISNPGLGVYPGLPRWLNSKESACNAGDARDKGSVPGLGRSPGEMHGNPLQYSYLENSMDRGALWAAVHGVAKCQARLTDYAHAHTLEPSSWRRVTRSSMLACWWGARLGTWTPHRHGYGPTSWVVDGPERPCPSP